MWILPEVHETEGIHPHKPLNTRSWCSWHIHQINMIYIYYDLTVKFLISTKYTMLPWQLLDVVRYTLYQKFSL